MWPNVSKIPSALVLWLSCGLLSSCQYQWGEPAGALQGHYSLGSIRNYSSYTGAAAKLETKLRDKLKSQSRVSFGSRVDDGYLIEFYISDISKSSLEQDERGHNTEVQFIIKGELRKSHHKGQTVSVPLSNQDHLSSSGSYRPLDINGNSFDKAHQTLAEDRALDAAMDDLVQRIVLYLAAHP